MKKSLLLPCMIMVFALASFSTPLLANTGVSVGTGKIAVDEKLKPGGTYHLPSITVTNSGTEPSDYSVSIQYHSDQTEKKPPAEWFTFSPSSFYLTPGASKTVETTISLPLSSNEGEYFAYLDARAVRPEGSPSQVSGAAATKLTFSVAPLNIFKGVYYKGLAYAQSHSPWSYVVLGAIGMFLLIEIRKRLKLLSANKLSSPAQ